MGFLAPALPYIVAAASVASVGASIATRPKIPRLSATTPEQDLERQKEAVVGKVQTREAEERRNRRASSVQTALTLGVPGATPAATQTIQPAPSRKTVLG